MSFQANRTLLVTGGCGFIGSNFVRIRLRAGSGITSCISTNPPMPAGWKDIAHLRENPRHTLVKGDILDRPLVEQRFHDHRPQATNHLAAEAHVDRSIVGPELFVKTNVEGTLTLLEAARGFWSGLDGTARASFRFLYVSTDEVYGSLAPAVPPSTEDSP